MKKLVYIGGYRGLIIYLLFNIKNIENTNFIFETRNKLNLKKYVLEEFQIKNKYYKKYILYKLFRKLSKNVNEIWIHDHLEYSEYFVSKFKNIKLLEDGLLNYTHTESLKKKKIKIKNWLLGGPLFIDRNRFGISDSISEIYLTNLKPIPKEIKSKVKIINLKEKWDSLDEKEKDKILNIFNFEKDKINKKLKNKKIILITQPLSEDEALTEEEKIDIYKNIIKKYNEDEILIKPHPREKTNYKKVFPNVEVLESDFPLEIQTFLLSDIKEVVTLFSTAVYNFEGIAKKIEFLGTKVNKKLIKKFGTIEK